jgi:hypothetical protein
MEGHMRIRPVIAIVSSVAMLVAQMPPGFAQNAAPPPVRVALPAQDATPSPAIVEAFNAFPKGGDQLSRRIADIIAKNPRLAAGLVKYVQTAPHLTTDQKLAAEQGLAAALIRLGVRAADMPVKAPPPAAPVAYDYSWILALLAIAALICLGVCKENPPVAVVSPN